MSTNPGAPRIEKFSVPNTDKESESARFGEVLRGVQVVMESTRICWKRVFAHLAAAGIPALVVNAFHVKNVPGRKTDVGDSEWLAQLARFGLLRGSFIPP